LVYKFAFETMTTSLAVKKNPPGPKTSWFGLSLVPALKNDTLGTVQKFHDQYGDVAYFQILNERYFALFSPDLIRQAMVERADDFVRHQRAMNVFTLIYGANVLTTDGDTWKRQRRILNPGFAPKKMAGYLGLMRDAVADSFAASLPQVSGASAIVDIDPFTTQLTMDVILRVICSYKADEAESVRIAAAVRSLEHQSMRELFWPMTPPNWFPFPGRKQKLQDKATLDQLIQGQIQLRRKTAQATGEQSDYLDMLLSARDEEGTGGTSAATLTDSEIHANCMVIFAAGHDTTASALTWWIGLMAQYPDYAKQVRQELQEVVGERNPTLEELTRLKWLNATIKESMRMRPSAVSLFNRRAVRDVRIGQWLVPKGAAVSVSIYHVHHDPRWYPEPEKFQPERFMPGAPEIPRGAYLPFGVGPHICIGQHLAMLEMALICAALVRQFNFEFLAGQSLPAPKIEMLLKPQTPLQIRFTRR